jgi:hypothetical protein
MESNYPVSGPAPYQGDIVFTGSLDLSNGNGGTSTAIAGSGSVTFNAVNGDVFLSGSITLGGGSATGDLSGAGAAFVVVTSGATGTQGGIVSSASITANGPSSSAGKGGVGGTVQFQVLDAQGEISLLPGSSISANGGRGGGAGGTGGAISLQTTSTGTGSGTVSVSGVLTALGGTSGAIGGQGGRFFVDSCTSGGVIGGDVIFDAGSLVDLSGGAGNSGGSAQNNGGAVTPPTRTPAGNFATCLEIWTHGPGLTPAEPTFPVVGGGRLVNNGLIRANGGSANGNGGDMNIDACKPDGSAAVTLGTLGTISNTGTGTGTNGIITVH